MRKRYQRSCCAYYRLLFLYSDPVRPLPTLSLSLSVVPALTPLSLPLPRSLSLPHPGPRSHSFLVIVSHFNFIFVGFSRPFVISLTLLLSLPLPPSLSHPHSGPRTRLLHTVALRLNALYIPFVLVFRLFSYSSFFLFLDHPDTLTLHPALTLFFLMSSPRALELIILDVTSLSLFYLSAPCTRSLQVCP